MIDAKCFTSCEKLTNLRSVLVRHIPAMSKTVPAKCDCEARHGPTPLASHPPIRHNLRQLNSREFT